MFFSNFFSKLKRFFSRSKNSVTHSKDSKNQNNNEITNAHNPKDKKDITPHKPTLQTKTLENEKETTTSARSIHQVSSITELSRAIKNAAPRDTIIITRAGRYGKIRLTNKSQLTIKALNTDMPIEASFFIDGDSQQIVLENMLLWHNIANATQIIITAKTTHSIIVQHCILSTVAVRRSTMLNAYTGNPRSWNNGIRMLGNNGQIINNNLINLNLAISQTGPNTVVKHNHIQFYTEDAIRISHHGVKVEHNTIYDSVIKRAGQQTHKDAIQLIPPENRFNAGTLNNTTITGNIIQSNSSAVPDEEHGIVQGIFGSDGHFVNTIISDNIIAVNSDHGITLNGVKNARIINNRVLDQTPKDHFQSGIKLYLTRISQGGKQSWLANLSYSVYLDNNQAPILNTPEEAYTVKDAGNNRIQTFSHHLARGHSPTIIRNTRSAMTKSFIKAKQKSLSKEKPEVTKSQPTSLSLSLSKTSSAKQTTHAETKNTVHHINNKKSLKQAITLANEGDTLLIEKAGHYGTIRLNNKKDITLKATDNHLTINARLLIDGTSNAIRIENLNIWYSENNWKPVILSTPSTHHIHIKNCLISSAPVTPNNADNGLKGQISQWITGIWLRGTDNHIDNNHLVNVSTGIIACSRQTLIENNRIQFYNDIAIRVFHHDIQVKHNSIYDAVNQQQGEQKDQQHSSIAIQLTPPEGRFEAGELKNIALSHNTIQDSSNKATVAKHLQGHVKGIVGKDGYMLDMLINNNTIVVNTEQGIELYGVSNLTLNGNKVLNSKSANATDKHFMAGIRLYYTRTIDLKGTRQQMWHCNRPYSVKSQDNTAPVFNIPNEGYQHNDEGGNQFEYYSDEQGKGNDPVIVS